MSTEDPHQHGRDPDLQPDVEPPLNPPEIGDEDADRARRELRADIGTYVSLAQFPTTVGELITVVSGKGAPEEVLTRLGDLPEWTPLASSRDLWVALGLEATNRF
jgi:hypothetical protein